MNPTPSMPKRNPGLRRNLYVNLKGTRKELAVMIPLGWTSKPMYHLEFLATTYGLQTRWLLVTFDWFRFDHKRYNKGKPNWRLQWQRKQFGTKYSVMVGE